MPRVAEVTGNGESAGTSAGRCWAVIGRPRRAAGLILALVLLSWLTAACGGDEEPELTIEEQLSIIEGRALRAAEVAERLAVGETLCQMDETVLDAIWFKLDDDQLEFQDLVFGRLCPERSIFYAGQTGRYVTEEASESGVVTSTTRPPPTTSTSAATTSTTRSAGASTTLGSSEAGPADSTDTSGSSQAGPTGDGQTTTFTTGAPATSSTALGEGG